MEYIIKSSSYRLLKEKINKITKNIDKDNITYYDLTIDNLNDIIEECNYTSLFDDKKAIIVYNTNLFNTKYEYKEDLELLEKYLNNPNVNTELIFITDSINMKKKCVKMINNKNNLFELEIKDDLVEKIKEYLNNLGYKIENRALSNLIKYELSNYDYILNEIDKVITIKKDYLITENDIDEYATKLESDNLFDFVNIIITKEEKNIYKYLIEYINNNKEPAILFSNLATQYRLIYSVKNLIKEGYSERDIADIFKIHSYRVKLAHDKSYEYTNNELKEKLLLIGKLDEKIKLGIINNYTALKYFLTALYTNISLKKCKILCKVLIFL